MTEILETMPAPTVDCQPSLPKRAGPKGLIARHEEQAALLGDGRAEAS